MEFHTYCIPFFWLLVNFIFDCSSKEVILRGCSSVGSNVIKSSNANEPWIIMAQEDSSKSINFRLLKDDESCDNQTKKMFINTEDWLQSATHLYFNGTNDQGKVIRLTLSLDGTVEIPTDYHNRQLPNSSYCISKHNATWSQIETCCTTKSPCYRKCCPVGQAFHFDYGCINVETKGLDEWYPPVYSETKNMLLHSRSKKIIKAEIGLPNCNSTTYISTALMKLNYSRIPYVLLQNGEVKYLDPVNQKKEWKQKSTDEDYCIDALLLPPELIDYSHCGPNEQDILLACINEPIESSSNIQPRNIDILRLIYVVFLGIAMLFLAATAVVNFLLKDKQNIHAWTIQCYVLSLFCFYFFLEIIYIGELMSNPLPKIWCIAVGVLTHFFGIFSFSWLSIINFDLWWTFRVLKPLNQKDIHCKRFLWYAIFATALPIIVILVSVGLDFYYEDKTCRDKPIDATIYPEYGKEICFLSNSAQLFYFYMPVGVLLLINLIFYSFTTYKIFNIYQVSQRVSSMKHRQSCQLFLKLFLVMGTAWSFQVIHAFVDAKESKWYWVFLDMVNIFQAIAIFVIFVCKRETLRSLQQKYHIFRGVCCHFNGVYRTPTLTDSRTDGSTRLSRAEGLSYKFGDNLEPQESVEITQLGFNDTRFNT